MIEIRGRRVGPHQPVFVLAEMAWAHDGSLDKAQAIVTGVVDAGADALNVHLTSLPDYMVRDYGAGPGVVSAGHDAEPVYDYLSRISLKEQDWSVVAATVHRAGQALSCMVNDVASLDLADRLDADLLVVPPACLAEQTYLEALGERRRPIMLGVGGAELHEIEQALNTLSNRGAGPLLLQYGIQSYPTDPRLVNLRYLVTLQEAFGLPVAYHDHTEAGTELATELPLLSLALGVVALEKHVTHSRAARGEDFESALEPAELKDFVGTVRLAEAALGSHGLHTLSEAELNYRRVVRKRAVARVDIAAGTRLDRSAITYKRANAGLYPDELDRAIGRRTTRPLKVDDPIVPEALG